MFSATAHLKRGFRMKRLSRLIPLLVLAYVAPFVAGPERVTRVLGGRKPERGVIIDVTPLNRRDDPGSAGDGSGDDRPDGGA